MSLSILTVTIGKEKLKSGATEISVGFAAKGGSLSIDEILGLLEIAKTRAASDAT